MIKKILLKIIYIFLVSGFNTYYKYITVKQGLNNYNFSFMSSYTTLSSLNVPYITIFFLSIASTIIFDIIVMVIIHFIFKRTFKDVFISLSNYLPLTISLLISFIFIQISLLFTIIVLLIGVFLYIYIIYRKTGIRYALINLVIFINYYILYLIAL